MTLKEQMQADIESAMETDLGKQVFTWRGEQYYCVPSFVKEGAELMEGGFGIDANVMMTVRLDQFSDSTYPNHKDSIEFNNNTYLIVRANKYANGAAMHYECMNTKYLAK